jgi:hypothetical protein
MRTMESLDPVPPDTGRDDAAWRAATRANVDLLRLLDERDPTPRDGSDLLLAQLERACLSLRTGTSAERDAGLWAATAAAHAAAIGAARTTGTVQLTHDGTTRSFPATGEPISPGLWVAGWATTLVTRDAVARSALELPAVVTATNAVGDPFWGSVLPALVSAAGAEREALAALDRAAEESAQPAAIVPEGYREQLVLPVLEGARALATHDPVALAAAVAEALRRHEEWYATETRYFDPMRLLSLPVLGLVARAVDLGMDGTPLDLPADLVAGPPPLDEDVRVTYEYSTRRARSADEVTWFLDLEGFPRDRREHVVVGRDAGLVAAYDVADGPGLAHARLEVELVDPGVPPGDGDLVDAGDLIAAADLLSRQAGAEELSLPARRARLDEAADCIAAALERLRRVAHPVDALSTSRGRAVFAAEPGRFDVERLDAVRTAWRGEVREWDQELGARQQRLSAAVSLTALRLHLEPILAALARDTGGEVAAGLRPSATDYGLVFTDAVADDAARLYAAFWAEPWHPQVPTAARSRTLCHLAPAGMLGDDNELSRPFPLGYRQVAPFLRPSRVWAAWKYVAPGSTSGLAFDGLVWCEDHWSWFPRPYRVLRVLVGG